MSGLGDDSLAERMVFWLFIGRADKNVRPPIWPSGFLAFLLKELAAATAAAAAAAAAAAFFLEVFGGGDAAEFDGGADVFGDFLLEGFQFALGGEKVAGDFVFEKGGASAFKLADLGGSEFDTGVLLVV